jgi:nucleotide-binding universal stress UspA family protein
MKVIVAAVDFSPAGSAAMRRAAQLAAGFGARLALLHVAAHRTPWERIAKAALPLAELRRQAAQVAAEHRIAVEAHLAKGAPHREIASFSREAKADLIVLGVRDSWIQDLLGSARAQRVRRRAAVPVLAVAGEPTGPYKRILVATDFSARSARAARLVSDFFPQATVRLLHVCPRLPGKAQTSRLVQAMQDLAAFALRTGLGGARLEVCAGEAAATIDVCAERIGADLVVVGPASKSWLGERLFFDVPDAMLSAPRRDTLIGAAARRLRQRSFNQDSPGSSAWDRTARNSASASRAPTVA